MDNDYKKGVGERIKWARTSHLGLSMEEFGKRLGTSRAAVNNWEKGKNLPNVSRLKKISEISGVDFEYLMYGPLSEIIHEIFFEIEEYRATQTLDDIDKKFKNYFIFMERKLSKIELDRYEKVYLKYFSESDDFTDLESLSEEEIASLLDDLEKEKDDLFTFLIDETKKEFFHRRADMYNRAQMIDIVNSTLAKIVAGRDYSNSKYINFIVKYIQQLQHDYSYEYFYEYEGLPNRGLSEELYYEINSILDDTAHKISKLKKKYK